MRLFLTLIIVLCVSSIPLAAQACGPYDLRGTWAVTCSGSITPGQGAPLTQTTLLGTCTFSSTGYATCEATASIGGVVVSQTANGQTTLNENCTGTVKYTQTVNGQPAPDLNVRFFLFDSSRQIRGMAIDQGSVLACKLYRMRH